MSQVKGYATSALVAFLAMAWVGAGPAGAQGKTDYFNVESPQVHPIEVFSVGGHDFVAVCNTPDNTVEIWDTDETLPVASRFVARVRTGLEPISVRWHAGLSRLYTANFLGDSVSVIAVDPGIEGSLLDARLLRTVRVTDEPMDLAFFTDPSEGMETVFVTHASLDAFGWYDAEALQPVFPGAERIFHNVPAGTDIDGDGNSDEIALKQPRSVLVGCGHLFVASLRGGNNARFDFDLYRRNLTTGDVTSFPGMGTSLFDMSFGPIGELLLVGTEARNAELRNEPMVRRATTGFTRNVLNVLIDPCGVSPQLLRRDINEIASTTLDGEIVRGLSSRDTLGGATPVAVGKAEALAQPTAVVAFAPPSAPPKFFLAAFGSDRLGVFEPGSPDTLTWPRRTIDISPLAATGNPRSGPRGLAIKPDTSSGPDATPPRLYVMNRLDNSVTIVDPVAETVVGELALTRDPTPEYIRHGRELLYSAELSGNGFVSCASCHIDGRTDGLGWDLGHGLAPDFLTALAQIQVIPPLLNDNPTNMMTEFPIDKSWMVTQSLQGLLNFEVDPETQSLYTNAPYHWRGDREDFLAFNVAFDGLLGGSEIPAADMELFEEMINSIHYPPNPLQPLDRIFSGDLGDPLDLSTGTGALRGMKLFHGNNASGLAACGQCHVMPAGSNNRITEEAVGKGAHTNTLFEPNQPIETPTLRGVMTKEAILALDGNPTHPSSIAFSGLEGIGHTGFQSPPSLPNFNDFANIDRFSQALFALDFCGAPFSTCLDLQEMMSFVFEMDWGVAPRVGFALTVEPTTVAEGTVAEIDALEAEVARAHIGLAVQAQIGGSDSGYWLDVTGASPVYRQEPAGAVLTKAQLLALLAGAEDRLVFLGTPLGSERRIASTLGVAPPLPGSAPTNLELLPMVPMASYEQIPSLVEFWELFDGGGGTFPEHGGSLGHAVRLYQYGLLQDGPPDGYGLDGIHWDAPRQFRVAGDDIRPGAQLHLFTHFDPTAGAPPNLGLGPEDPGQVAMRRSVLPLYPTDQRTPGGQVIWRTAVQAEMETYYRMMHGGEFAPGVEAAYSDNFFAIPEPPPVGMFDPEAWNWHYLRVVNADGTVGDGGWVRLRIE